MLSRFIKKAFALTAHNIFTARKERQQFGGYGTAHKSEHTNGRNSEPNRKQRISHITTYQPLGYVIEEEDMHQVHAEGEFGKSVYP